MKIHCSVLAEDAIRAAIGDWKKKNGVAETDGCGSARISDGLSTCQQLVEAKNERRQTCRTW